MHSDLIHDTMCKGKHCVIYYILEKWTSLFCLCARSAFTHAMRSVDKGLVMYREECVMV